MRHTDQPLTAGFLHGSPVRFDRAVHLGDLCMGYASAFFISAVLIGHNAGDHLTTISLLRVARIAEKPGRGAQYYEVAEFAEGTKKPLIVVMDGQTFIGECE